jgi:hypothetical protein
MRVKLLVYLRLDQTQCGAFGFVGQESGEWNALADGKVSLPVGVKRLCGPDFGGHKVLRGRLACGLDLAFWFPAVTNREISTRLSATQRQVGVSRMGISGRSGAAEHDCYSATESPGQAGCASSLPAVGYFEAERFRRDQERSRKDFRFGVGWKGNGGFGNVQRMEP